jgi:enoyl-CoA hydratase
MTAVAMGTTYETLLLERLNRVAVVTFNRPQALNVLNGRMMHDVVGLTAELDRDSGVGAIVLTGSERAFAAGTDMTENCWQSFSDAYLHDWFRAWDRFAEVRTPTVAAVAGYALGGGCELAMMCDVILAGDTAMFGQPEIKLGAIPGLGGSQRLTRAVGKAKAMELCLTGRLMDAVEAERAGLVSRVVPAADLLAEAVAVATTIAEMSPPVAMMAKESVNRSFETTLSEGARFERRMFQSTFSTRDRKEGVAALADKRPPIFLHS